MNYLFEKKRQRTRLRRVSSFEDVTINLVSLFSRDACTLENARRLSHDAQSAFPPIDAMFFYLMRIAALTAVTFQHLLMCISFQVVIHSRFKYLETASSFPIKVVLIGEVDLMRFFPHELPWPPASHNARCKHQSLSRYHISFMNFVCSSLGDLLRVTSVAIVIYNGLYPRAINPL